MKQLMRGVLFFLSCIFFTGTLYIGTARSAEGPILLAKKNKHKHQQTQTHTQTQTTKIVTHTYHYYPKSHVYFNPGQNLYFFLVGTQWKSAAQLPADIIIEPGDHTVLDLKTDKPYENFNIHQVRFSREREYRFFPTLGVYFDPTDKVWFHQEGTVWKISETLPGNIQFSTLKPVVIRLDTLRPFTFYDVHKVKYHPNNKNKHE